MNRSFRQQCGCGMFRRALMLLLFLGVIGLGVLVVIAQTWTNGIDVVALFSGQINAVEYRAAREAFGTATKLGGGSAKSSGNCYALWFVSYVHRDAGFPDELSAGSGAVCFWVCLGSGSFYRADFGTKKSSDLFADWRFCRSLLASRMAPIEFERLADLAVGGACACLWLFPFYIRSQYPTTDYMGE